jgi:hypothetical protein
LTTSQDLGREGFTGNSLAVEWNSRLAEAAQDKFCKDLCSLFDVSHLNGGASPEAEQWLSSVDAEPDGYAAGTNRRVIANQADALKVAEYVRGLAAMDFFLDDEGAVTTDPLSWVSLEELYVDLEEYLPTVPPGDTNDHIDFLNMQDFFTNAISTLGSQALVEASLACEDVHTDYIDCDITAAPITV